MVAATAQWRRVSGKIAFIQPILCGVRHLAESAALLVDEVLPHEPMRQWVLSVPFPLRFLFASQPKIMGKALGIIYRTIATHLTRKAGYTKTTAHTGAVTLIQRFGGALNLNIHFHMLFLDSVYVDVAGSFTRFRWVIHLANYLTIFNFGCDGLSNKSIVCLNRSFFTNAAYALSVVFTEACPSKC
mgnify:CR=1 FL=1